MDDTQKMLRVIINGQSSLKQELTSKIDRLGTELNRKIDKLDGKIDNVERNLTARLDKIGKQLAYLEDDTPTQEEFNKLKKRVDKIEQTIISA